jgi:hypothetical protein
MVGQKAVLHTFGQYRTMTLTAHMGISKTFVTLLTKTILNQCKLQDAFSYIKIGDEEHELLILVIETVKQAMSQNFEEEIETKIRLNTFIKFFDTDMHDEDLFDYLEIDMPVNNKFSKRRKQYMTLN